MAFSNGGSWWQSKATERNVAGKIAGPRIIQNKHAQTNYILYIHMYISLFFQKKLKSRVLKTSSSVLQILLNK